MTKGIVTVTFRSKDIATFEDSSVEFELGVLIVNNCKKNIIIPLDLILMVESESNGTIERKPRYNTVTYTEDFEQFWQIYPKMPRVGKQVTFKLYQFIPPDERYLIVNAVTAYSKHILEYQRKPRDPERFIKDNFWRDWVQSGGETCKATSQDGIEQQA